MDRIKGDDGLSSLRHWYEGRKDRRVVTTTGSSQGQTMGATIVSINCGFHARAYFCFDSTDTERSFDVVSLQAIESSPYKRVECRQHNRGDDEKHPEYRRVCRGRQCCYEQYSAQEGEVRGRAAE